MALSITPYAIPASGAAPCGILPPGPYYALISGGTVSANGIFLGMGTAVTASTGMYIPGGGAPVPLNGLAGQASQPLYAIAASGTVTAVLMVITPR